MPTLSSRLKNELKAFRNPIYFCENILNIKPYPMQKEILHKFYCSPNHTYTHMILVCGMRSGKTQLGAMATTYETFKMMMLGDPQKHYGLPPGQPIYCLHVANSRDQAKDTIFAQTAGLLENAEWFIDHGMIERTNEFQFPDYNIYIHAEHSNSASLAGRTAKMVVLDETARFKDNQGKFSGDAVYFTVSRAVKTFGQEGKVFSVSSPIYDDDFQMRLYRKGLKLGNFLCYQKATWEMNPRFTFESLQHEFDLNPETAWRDYGAKPPSAVEAYFRDKLRLSKVFNVSAPQIIENDTLITHVMPKPRTNYYLAGDPAVKNDAFGLALVHDEKDNVIVDFVHRFKPPEGQIGEIDAEKVKKFILSVANHFPLRTFIIDTWQYPETIQAIERAGIFVKQHTVKKPEYDCLKEYIYTGKIKIPENEKLFDELKSLELVRGIRVDHPKNGSKDMADALANAVWELKEDLNMKPMAWVPVRKHRGYEKIDPLPPVIPFDEAEFHDYYI